MSAVVLALGAALCLGTSDFVFRRATMGGATPGGMMLLQSVVGAAVTLPAAWVLGAHGWHPGAWWGIANGALVLGGFWCAVQAYARAETTLIAPLVRLNFAVTGALTVALLGESLGVARIAGLACAAAAILCLGGEYARLRGHRAAVAFALGALLAFGLSGLMLKLGLRAGAGYPLLAAAQALGMLAAAAVAAVASRAWRPGRGDRPLAAVACGALIAGFYLGILAAFARADAVLVAPIAQLGFVWTGVLAVTVLRETVTRSRLLAFAFAIGAVAAFAAS